MNEETFRGNNMKSLTLLQRKAVLYMGHVIDCFDITLYGFFAVHLASLFYPSENDSLSLLVSFGAFAMGFLARPMGALFFGHLGDTLGRKKSLTLAMVLISIPTFVIGVLPTYHTLGIISPILLMFCRLAQGFLIGGEFTGANLYIYEERDTGTRGRQTGMLISSGVIGAVMATSMGGLVVMEQMPFWFWRIPFIFGGAAALIVYFFRRRLPETPFYIQAKEANKVVSSPWKPVFKSYKRCFAAGCLIAGMTIIPLYCATIFGNKIFKELGYSSSECLMLNTYGMVLDAILVFSSGFLADAIGFRRLMTWGTALIGLMALPSMYPVMTNPSFGTVMWFISSMVAVGAVINGCAMPYISQFFPTHCRYSGVALSVTTGQALFGGTLPFLATYFTDLFHTSLAPAYWVMLMSLVATSAIILTRVDQTVDEVENDAKAALRNG